MRISDWSSDVCSSDMTPDADGRALLLSMRRMRKIRSVSGEDNALVAEAGVILSDVHDAAEAADRFFPLSLAAKGSATVGGLVSTNGGGVQVQIGRSSCGERVCKEVEDQVGAV